MNGCVGPTVERPPWLCGWATNSQLDLLICTIYQPQRVWVGRVDLVCDVQLLGQWHDAEGVQGCPGVSCLQALGPWGPSGEPLPWAMVDADEEWSLWLGKHGGAAAVASARRC